MKGNPITRKDLTITSRSMKFSWGLFAYEGILTIVFLFALGIMGLGGRHYATDQADVFSRFIAMFPVVAVAELCIVSLIIPVTTATSISGERERQTFDIMLTTQISPLQIVLGKMFTSVIRILIYVIASIPIMAVAFTIGGISWLALFAYVLLVTVLAFFEASVGVFCSTVCKKGITGILASYVILGFIYGGSFIPLLISVIADEFSTMLYGTKLLYSLSAILLLPNPIVTFIEFFCHVIAGESFLVKGMCDQGFSVMEFFSWGWLWIVLSCAVMLLLSWGFVLLAAYRIDPLHAKKGKG